MFVRPSRSEASTVTLATVIAAVGIAGLISGCHSSFDRLNLHIQGNILSVHSSMPLRGPYARESLGIVDGEKLALEQAGGMVNGLQVKFYLRDDSNGPRGWGVTAVADNARTALEDRTTIAYLGDFDSGASAFFLSLLIQLPPALAFRQISVRLACFDICEFR